jgi:hypothetical protein
MGVPSNYKPAATPLWPYPANYNSLTAANDPNYGNYGTNNVFLPVTNQTAPFRLNLNGATAGSPLHPWINQPILSTNLWNVDASINKSFSIREKAKLRVQADFFNVFNTPGNAFAAASDGTVPTWTNQNGARVMQLSARLSW